MAMFFTQIYIYDNNNKNIYMLTYKNIFKKCQLIRWNSICCLKNQAIFHRVNIEIDLTPPSPCLFSFALQGTPSPPASLHNNPFIKKGLLEEMEGVNDNAGAFMHLNIKANK